MSLPNNELSFSENTSYSLISRSQYSLISRQCGLNTSTDLRKPSESLNVFFDKALHSYELEKLHRSKTIRVFFGRRALRRAGIETA